MSLLLICSWVCSDCLLWFDLSGYQMLSDRFCFALCAPKTWNLPIIITLFPAWCHLNGLKIAFSTFLLLKDTRSDNFYNSFWSTTTQKQTGSKGVRGAPLVLCLPRVPGEIKLYALVQIFLLCVFLYAAALCSFLAATCYHGNSNFWQHLRKVNIQHNY